VTKPNGSAGIRPGQPLPPFAVPLALSTLNGDPDIAVHANEGSRGKVPACQLREPRVLNICQLYEHNPVVLALFVPAGSCPKVLDDMQALARRFPAVRFAAVALTGSRDSVRRLIASHHIGFPVGFDRSGELVALYKVASCPQLTFVLPGGRARGEAVLSRPPPSTLERRVEDLVAAAKSGGWRAGG
jgi:hypothetical protein